MTPDPGREERRRRRQVLKAHHPDLGGNAVDFIRVAAELGTGRRRPPATPTRLGDEVRFVRRPRGLGRLTAWYRRRRRPPRVH
ncbi:hypothetical protein DQ239_04780 [Blastococcus sp. TF02-09]|uniref:hypothetical protein n=1 Tax=Blastococcus sp. TF02-09 TaxID=2250576 RepID=UPI000DE87C4F|nr:hypothetical protein [Blastococcus sp. TF02-9]RBY80366.1 hypothetical protein DQ239_04780 [Blastococcus sp. TF02-9]